MCPSSDRSQDDLARDLRNAGPAKQTSISPYVLRGRGPEDEPPLHPTKRAWRARTKHSRASYEAQLERWAQEVACENLGTGG